MRRFYPAGTHTGIACFSANGMCAASKTLHFLEIFSLFISRTTFFAALRNLLGATPSDTGKARSHCARWQATGRAKPCRDYKFHWILGAENFASTTAARSQHPAPVFGRHTGTKAMHLAALALFRLIGPKHKNNTPRPYMNLVCVTCATFLQRRIPQNSYSSILTRCFSVKRKFQIFPIPTRFL